MVRGADGKDYGPVNLEQLHGWIRERRLSPQQEVRRSDMQQWAAAGAFAELQPVFGSLPSAPAPMPSAAATTAPADAAAVAQLKSGASWFYWIAGLSLINSIAAVSGGSWRFILGLGITQEINAHLESGKGVVLLLDLLAAGVFILFGIFAHKAHTWAFVLGMALFALDGVIFVLIPDWIGVGFHVLVLYFLFRGFAACRRLNARP